MTKYEKIINYMDELFPNPKCELDYTSDYTLLINIVLSAQTKDSRVNEVTHILYTKYPNLKLLSEASLDNVKEILKPLGNYNKKAEYVLDIAKRLHNDYEDRVPLDENILLSFMGVGRKTVNVFLAEYYNIPKIAVDTHVNRVSKRLGLVKDSDSVLDVENVLCSNIPKNKWARSHLQLVLFGRYHCKSNKPKCSDCKLKEICKYNK